MFAPLIDGTLGERLVRWTIWQLPTCLFTLILVGVLVVDKPHGAGLWSLVVGAGGIIVSTIADVIVPWQRFSALARIVLPISDLLGVLLLNYAGEQNGPPTILLCSLPAVWLTFEFGFGGFVVGIAGTVVVATSPFALGREAPDSLSGLVSVGLPPCLIVAVTLISRTLGVAFEADQKRLTEGTRDLSSALALAQDRLMMMNGVLASVDAGVSVLLAEGVPVHNDKASDLLVRGGWDPADPTAPATRIYAADGTTPVAPEHQIAPRAARGEEFVGIMQWVGHPGDQVAMIASARRLTREDGRYLGSVLSSWDATDLLESIRIREDFLTTVSHELRTPLTSMMGYLELLEEMAEMPPARAEQILVIVSRNADLLLERISQLLDVSDGPNTSHAPTDTDVSSLVHVAMVKHEIGARGAEVELLSSVAEGVVAELDPQRFEQVIDNLVTNAIKFSRVGGHVEVRLRRSPSGFCLSVTDDGIGMTSDEQRQAFDRFYRADAAISGAVQGLGIGLGLVAAIVHRHHGQVSISAAPGGGTIVDVDVPTSSSVEAVPIPAGSPPSRSR